MMIWDDKKKDLVWQYTGEENAGSSASTTTSTETNTSNVSDSYNTSNYDVQDYSNVGNVTVGATGFNNPTLLAGLVALALVGVILIIARKS